MEEVKAKKDGQRWLFSQIVVISGFTKNPDSYPANSLKRNKEVFLHPWRKKVWKINSEIPKPWIWKCVIRMKNYDLDKSLS